MDVKKSPVNVKPAVPSALANGTQARIPKADWTWKWNTRIDKNFPKPPFTGPPPGSKCDLKGHPEIDFFSLYFNEAFVSSIVEETNRYAKGKNSNSNRKRWTDVTAEDVFGCFAIILHMTLVKKPKIADYWARKMAVNTPFASTIMSRQRFSDIFTRLHLVDNDKRPQHSGNRSFMIQPMIDNFNRVSKVNLDPGVNLCIDEAMCPFRGRVQFKVYMKCKPTKYGIKFYALADVDTGYMLNIKMYTGAEISKIPGESKDVVSITDKLVINLMKNYLNKGYTLYTDRYYTSPLLMEYLWKSEGALGWGADEGDFGFRYSMATIVSIFYD